MKKILLTMLMILCSVPCVMAAEVDLNELDEQSRSSQAGGSLMFKRNADQYRKMSDEEKAQIEQEREEARRQAEIYKQQQEEYMRRARQEAERRAREEAERRRAEALKPVILYGNKLKIYALVNGEVITSSDMQSRINTFILTTGIPYNAQTKNMITTRVLQAAIDEKLKIQEARKNKIRVSQAEIDRSIRNFEKSNNMPAGELKKILTQAGVSMKTWNTQIEADIAWQKLISQKGYSQIRISEGAVNKALSEIESDIKIQKWMVSEIVINKKDAKDINQLVNTLKKDPRFDLYARQFSQSPSSANGGQLGWVTKGKLPAVLEREVLKMKEGEVIGPISYGNDYYILKLDRIFNPKSGASKIPTKQEIRTFLENKRLEELSTKYIKDLRSRALIEKKI